MNVVDSSGWLEYITDSPNASMFAAPINRLQDLVVPSITIAEVFRKMLHVSGEPLALKVAAQMRQGILVDLDASLAMDAAKIGHDARLPMVDSIILATARRYHAVLWTQDEDFQGIEGVRFVKKRV